MGVISSVAFFAEKRVQIWFSSVCRFILISVQFTSIFSSIHIHYTSVFFIYFFDVEEIIGSKNINSNMFLALKGPNWNRCKAVYIHLDLPKWKRTQACSLKKIAINRHRSRRL